MILPLDLGVRWRVIMNKINQGVNKMKSHYFHIALLNLILIFNFCLAAEAKTPFIQDQSKYNALAEVEAGGVLYIKDAQYDVAIKGVDKNTITVEAAMEVGGIDEDLEKEFFTLSKLILEPYKNGYRLEMKTPKDDPKFRRNKGILGFLSRIFIINRSVSTSIEMKIEMPDNYSLIVENKYGDIEAINLTGEIDIRNTSGEVTVKKGGGNLTIHNNYSTIEVTNFKGDVWVKGGSCPVEIIKVEGNVDCYNSYKMASVSQVSGNLKIKGTSSDVNVADIGGDCEIQSSYKPVRIENVEALQILEILKS